MEGSPGNSVGHTYILRTEINVKDADDTAIFGNADPVQDKGTARTLDLCNQHHKPIIHFDQANLQTLARCAEQLRRWAIDHNIRVLNVAGTWKSRAPGLEDRTAQVIQSAFQELKKAALTEASSGTREKQSPTEEAIHPVGKPIQMSYKLSRDGSEPFPVDNCFDASRGYGRVYTTCSFDPQKAYQVKQGDVAIVYRNETSRDQLAVRVGEQYRITDDMIRDPAFRQEWAAKEKHSPTCLTPSWANQPGD